MLYPAYSKSKQGKKLTSTDIIGWYPPEAFRVGEVIETANGNVIIGSITWGRGSAETKIAPVFVQTPEEMGMDIVDILAKKTLQEQKSAA